MKIRRLEIADTLKELLINLSKMSEDEQNEYWENERIKREKVIAQYDEHMIKTYKQKLGGRKMINNQVTLPKEVAEAIESEKLMGYSNERILTFPYSDCYQRGTSRDIIYRYRKDNFDTLMTGLVNGYETEKTPHEKLLLYYSHLIEAEDKLENNNQSGSQFRQGWMSVKETLKILGIEVKGINDN